MKILLSGFCCAPGMGSEPGLTWNWATQLSQRHEVWVMCYPEWRKEIEARLRQAPNPNLHFEYITLPNWLNPWKPERGERWVRLHYFLWLKVSYSVARRLHKEIGFDLSHHVSWSTFGAMPALWKLPIPFFWGPVGGAQSAPKEFRHYFGKDRLAQVLRSARILLTKHNPFFRRALKRCALVLATEHDTKELLESAGAERVQLLIDGGVDEEWFCEPLDAAEIEAASGPRTSVLHWCGRLDARKGLALAIEALAAAGDVDVELEVSGRGPELDRCEKLATSLGVAERVKFLGALAPSDLHERLRRADALMVTSLRDSFVTVTLEAAAKGLPIITLDHQGGRLLPNEACWKVPVTSPRATVAALAGMIREAAPRSQGRLDRGEAALRFARANTWKARIRQMEIWYEQYR